jgi:hypothetical protein
MQLLALNKAWHAWLHTGSHALLVPHEARYMLTQHHIITACKRAPHDSAHHMPSSAIQALW